MLQSMGLQRFGHNLVTEQQKKSVSFTLGKLYINLKYPHSNLEN